MLFHPLQPVEIETTGSAGSAEGSNTTNIVVNGALYGYYVEYDGDAPNTTVITVKDGYGHVLHTGEAGNTNGFVWPRAGDQGNILLPLVGQKITFEISASDELAVAATIYPIVLE